MPEARARTTTFGFVIAFLTLGSCACFLASMHVYPGGNWIDVRAPGHDFARNFLCDILAPVAQNDVANPVGSRLALAGYLLFACAFALHWWRLPAFLARDNRRTRFAVRWMGVGSTLAMVAVPLWPPSAENWLHQIVVYASGIPGGVAALLACVGLWRAGERAAAGFGAFVLATTLGNGAVYALHMALSGEPTVVLPLLQRIGAVSMVAWVLALAARHLQPARQTATS